MPKYLITGVKLGNANTWSALQTFSAGLTVSGGTFTVGTGFEANGAAQSQIVGILRIRDTNLSGTQNIVLDGRSNVGTGIIRFGTAEDVVISRDAAGTLALRNGTNAQTFNLYNTYTDGSNYERGFMRFTSNILRIGAESAGSGTARNTEIIGGTGTTSTLTLQSTSGVGTTGADIIFKVGNNGATEAMRVLNNGNVGIGTTGPASLLDLRAGDLTFSGANGQKYVQGRLTELVAVGSGLTTKATTIQIPADAIVYAVPVRVNTQPGGTATMTVTATTSGTAFQKGASISTVAGTTDPGMKNTPANYNSVAAQTVTFTFNAATTDALGVIRVDIYYATSTPPTS